MIGFADKHRAAEVLSQLQRLKFDWASDLRNGVAVEVEADGRLRMLQSHLLDPAAKAEDDFEWEALLSALVPQPHSRKTSHDSPGASGNTINIQGQSWLKNLALDLGFTRDAAALLRPGNSAILATIHDWRSAMELLSGYSAVVLHTTVFQPKG